jgi:DNA-binding MarR family transcriptional regulator
VGILDTMSDPAAPSDVELATLVEHLLADTWWRVTCELPSDLSRTAASSLRALAQDGPQRVTTLSAHEQVAQPTMSMIVKRLEQRGLVQRAVDPVDARATLVSITDAGLETLSERAEARLRWFAVRLAELEPGDRCSIAAAIEKLAEALG